MADTPEGDNAAEHKPAPRRRAPRKTAEHAAPKKAAPRRAAKPKSTLEQLEDAAAEAVKAPATAVASTAKRAVKAVKPRSSGRATPRPAAKKSKAEPKSRIAAATDKVGGKWGAAAIAAGGLVAGAAATALLSLRGSTPKTNAPKTRANTDPNATGAHQPDGADSTASFEAGIADEQTIPE